MKLLFISITNHCNRSCAYCPVKTWRNNPNFPDSLTLEKCIKAIEFLNPTHIEITGGEPTSVQWLDNLLDYLESKGIIYLVKSNGLKRCRNQITAWHDEIPVYYDKMLIIKNTPEWREKEHYCKEHGIPYGIIGFNNLCEECRASNVPAFFMCPDGHIKQCHEMESDSLRHVDHIGTDLERPPVWKAVCASCKAVNDYLIFLENN